MRPFYIVRKDDKKERLNVIAYNGKWVCVYPGNFTKGWVFLKDKEFELDWVFGGFYA